MQALHAEGLTASGLWRKIGRRDGRDRYEDTTGER
jgi:hypothetical protein